MPAPAASHHEERLVEAQPGIHLWADVTGDPDATPVLLVMGANATGVAWPDALVTRLAERHRVLRYDHRDTGRSTRAFAERPYPITQLARDALAVLDGFGVDRAHVAGMSLGGTLLQLLLLDAPDRLLSATLFSTGALAGDPALPGEDELPGPSEDVLAMWEHLGESRRREQEVAFNLEYWRALSGAGAGGHLDPGEFRALEERVRAHTGHDEPIIAHASPTSLAWPAAASWPASGPPGSSSTRRWTPSSRRPTPNISRRRSRRRAA
jgi:pimeloyl-ACP methyl ester carboxylesterase